MASETNGNDFVLARVMKLNYSVIAGTCIAVYALLSMSTAEACSVDLYSQYDTIHLEYNGTIDGASTLDKEDRAL